MSQPVPPDISQPVPPDTLQLSSQSRVRIPAILLAKLKINENQLRDLGRSVGGLKAKAITTREPNPNLERGFKYNKSSLNTLEASHISLIESHERYVLDDPRYNEIQNGINTLNETLSDIADKCQTYYTSPDMSAQYFKTLQIPDFHVTKHSSPGFFKAIDILRDIMNNNKASDGFYLNLVETNLKKNDKELFAKKS